MPEMVQDNKKFAITKCTV